MPGKAGDVWKDILGSEPTKQPQNDHRTPTEAPQSAHNAPMKEYRVRLPETWWQALRERAAAEGLKPSQVVRRLVAEYLGK